MESETPPKTSRPWLWIELLSIFVAAPLGLVFVRQSFSRMIIPTLCALALLCFVLLWRDPRFQRRRLGWNGAITPDLKIVLKTFVPGALLLGGAVALLRPDLLFSFPRREPVIWLVVMLAYPLLSVYPQELLFRTFFFHRYRPILGTPNARILWSALVFGLAHVFFANWVAPVLTAIGGYLFARTYERGESTAMAALEHALWGDFIFTIGLGWYFYGGSIRSVAQATGG